MAYLLIKSLNKKVKIDSVPEIRIGSGEKCNLRFKSNLLGDVHCIIKKSDQGYKLEALGEVSVNSVKVNVKLLTDNDQIKIAHLEFTFIKDGNQASNQQKIQSAETQKIPIEPAKIQAVKPKAPPPSSTTVLRRSSFDKLKKVQKEAKKKKKGIHPVYFVIGVVVSVVVGVIYIMVSPGADAYANDFQAKMKEIDAEKNKLKNEGKFEDVFAKIKMQREEYAALSDSVKKIVGSYSHTWTLEEAELTTLLTKSDELEQYYTKFIDELKSWEAVAPSLQDIQQDNYTGSQADLKKKADQTQRIFDSPVFLSLNAGIPEFKSWKGDFDKKKKQLAEFKEKSEQIFEKNNPDRVFKRVDEFIEKMEWSKAKATLEQYKTVWTDKQDISRAEKKIDEVIIPEANDEWNKIKRDIKKMKTNEEKQKEFDKHKGRFEGVVKDLKLDF
ncbi:MAG: hypothetical protein HY606_03310 [Planctomycetes bacterium]|nr:hypothetical protein [Planctomycetota bacterium]